MRQMAVASGHVANGARTSSVAGWRRLPSSALGSEARRRRWTGIATGALTYAVALYLAYTATFIYFVSTPYHPGGPYGEWTCQQPHVIFGQICRDMTERGMTSTTRLGLGAVFLVGFLLVVLVARRFVEVLFLIPLLTLPYVAAEPNVWIASTLVVLIAVAAIAALQLSTGAVASSRFKWIPLGMLSVGTAGSVVLSVFTFGWTPTVPTVPVNSSSTAHEVSMWPSVELFQIACSSELQCVAAGDRRRGDQGDSAVVGTEKAARGVPIILSGLSGPIYRVACASSGNCISMGFGANASTLPISTEFRDRWRTGVLSFKGTFGLFGSATGCSSGGMCWAVVNDITSGSGTNHTWSYAIGTRDGRWVERYKLGGPTLRIRGRVAADVGVRDIDCWSASSCTVLGLAASAHSSTAASFLQTETNGRWGPPAMLPVAPTSGFAATASEDTLSCTSSDDCLVSGSDGNGGDIGAVEQEVGGRWEAPIALGLLDPKATSAAYAVSCRAAGFCVAAGWASPRPGLDGGPTYPFVQVEVDRQWRAPVFAKGPEFVNAAFFVTGIECPTSSGCVVVGNVDRSRYMNAAFIARYFGSRWHWSLASINGQWRDLSLEGLSCSAGHCWVSGSFYGSHDVPTGVVAPLDLRGG